MARVNGIALAAAGAGALFAWSGLKGGHVLVNLQDVITGKQPSDAGANPIDSAPVGTGTPVTVAGPDPAGNAIASDALSYVGKFPYVWGGAPASGGSDCSGFANMVIGRDLGLAIPGYRAGSYTGAAHGPPTVAWLASIGTVVTHIPRGELAAGDIACWQTHMGIAISNSQMVSAEDPAQGTQVGTIDGFIPGEVLFCLRLKAVTAPGAGGKK